MALTKCPECGKENVSDKAKACPECGYLLQNNTNKVAISQKVPFVLSIMYSICVIIYATDYLWVFTSVMMLLVGLVMGVILCPKLNLSTSIKSNIILMVSLIGSFIIAFDYNLARLEWGFFNNYDDSLGFMLALFQIITVVGMILIALRKFMPQINKNATVVCLFASGILGLAFSIFEVNYLSSKWGTGSNAFYIWNGFVSLLWFITQATYLLSSDDN